MRVLTKRLDSETDLERFSRSGYELALMDTCFIVKYIDLMPALTDLNSIKRSRILPAICDFVKRELQMLSESRIGFAPWRRLNKTLKDDSLIIYLKTDFGRGYFLKVLRMLEGGYVEAFKRAYAGNRGRSNKRDQYLYVAAAYLNQVGVDTSVATTDGTLIKSLKASGIKAYSRPWIEEAAEPGRSHIPTLDNEMKMDIEGERP